MRNCPFLPMHVGSFIVALVLLKKNLDVVFDTIRCSNHYIKLRLHKHYSKKKQKITMHVLFIEILITCVPHILHPNVCACCKKQPMNWDKKETNHI